MTFPTISMNTLKPGQFVLASDGHVYGVTLSGAQVRDNRAMESGFELCSFLGWESFGRTGQLIGDEVDRNA